MKIGVFGSASDPEVQALTRRLSNRGVECPTIDLSLFPSSLRLCIAEDTILADELNLLDLDAAYLRSSGGRYPLRIRFDERGRLLPIRFPTHLEAERALKELARHRLQEDLNQRIRQSVLRAFQDRRPLVNPPRQNGLHRLKPYLLHRLLSSGVPVPEYVVASAGEELSAFSKRNSACGGNTVIKPLAGIFKTELLRDTNTEADAWRRRGVLYQTYVDGETIRCYVLDGRVLAAAVILHGDGVDSSLSQTGIRTVQLSPPAERIARQTALVLGARFCGIDLMRDTRSGDCYVIDCNFSPMFVTFSRLARIDVAAYLAEHLIELAQATTKSRRAGFPLLKQAQELLAEDPQIRRKMGL